MVYGWFVGGELWSIHLLTIVPLRVFRYENRGGFIIGEDSSSNARSMSQLSFLEITPDSSNTHLQTAPFWESRLLLFHTDTWSSSPDTELNSQNTIARFLATSRESSPAIGPVALGPVPQGSSSESDAAAAEQEQTPSHRGSQADSTMSQAEGRDVDPPGESRREQHGGMEAEADAQEGHQRTIWCMEAGCTESTVPFHDDGSLAEHMRVMHTLSPTDEETVSSSSDDSEGEDSEGQQEMPEAHRAAYSTACSSGGERRHSKAADGTCKCPESGELSAWADDEEQISVPSPG